MKGNPFRMKRNPFKMKGREGKPRRSSVLRSGGEGYTPEWGGGPCLSPGEKFFFPENGESVK